MANELVLIIDDSSQTINFISDYVLKPNNYQILVAPNGEIGLKLAIEQRPDLILLDMSMAEMTGMEVLDALNTHDIKIPVIVMTFHGSETLAVQAFRMGVKDYILKPFTVSEMLDSIERALAEVRLRQERDDLTERLIQTNQALEQRLKELNTLFGIGKSVTSVLDQQKLLARLVEAGIYLTDAEEGRLLLVDNDSAELYVAAARGIDERLARSFRQKIDDSLAGRVVKSGEPFILTDDEAAALADEDSIRSLIYVPLKIKGQVRGVLGVANRHQNRDFSNHDLRLLSTLADYAAISLENAQLFNQIDSERNKLATVLSEIAEPVVVIDDTTDQIVVANIAFGRAFGLSEMIIEGQTISNLLPNKPLTEFITAAERVESGFKGEIPLDDGRTFYATLTPIPKVGRAIVMQDVTHFRKLNQMKSDFVSTVSRDLQAPLNSVKAYAQMLSAAGNLDDKQQLFIDRITSGVEQVIDLINNLLELNAIELGIEPHKTVVNLAELATETVAEFQSMAKHKRQQLVCHIANQDAPVAGSELRLKQVISNLLDNALRYASEEGQIAALVQVKEQQVLFSVEDNGIGIPPANLPLIFDKFFRVERDDQVDSSGNGLGLAICKAIVESHNGHIWVDSQLNQGSIFTFALPLASAENSQTPQAETQAVAA